MICIQFQNAEEAKFLHKLYEKQPAGYIQFQREGSFILFNFSDKERAIPFIKYLLLKLITEKKRIEWCRKILEEQFFYTDQDEQAEIIQLTCSILDGQREEIPVKIDRSLISQRLDYALTDILEREESFSFEAFHTFQLRFYKESLFYFVETALDEYKLEQEYQSFIYYLRRFLKGRKPRLKKVYLVNSDGFTFYDQNMREIKRADLDKHVDRRLLSRHTVYVDSVIIAPLISIAPEQIYLYTDDPESGIIQTLKNIFEEKLKICSLESFRAENDL